MIFWSSTRLPPGTANTWWTYAPVLTCKNIEMTIQCKMSWWVFILKFSWLCSVTLLMWKLVVLFSYASCIWPENWLWNKVMFCSCALMTLRYRSLSHRAPGPSCSNLMTSLVKVTLKFRMYIFEICQYFLLEKYEKLLQCKLPYFFNKNISVFGYKVIKHLTSWPLNELIKLTMLWTTGPSYSKLTTSLADETLNFQRYRMQKLWHFLLKKMRRAFAVQKLLTIFQPKILLQLIFWIF